MTERYVVLGVAPARSGWFRNVAQWANDGSIGIQFVKCVSVVELRAHLRSARAFSAVMVDGALPSLDRDLVDEAVTGGIAVVVVDTADRRRDWGELGASAVVTPTMTRDELNEILSRHAKAVSDHDALPGDLPPAPTAGFARAEVTAVCGPGGTGASTIAMAAAQALGDDPALGGMVLLADCARRAELAMLHDAGDVVPGVQDLVEAHRGGRPALDVVRAATFAVSSRRYDLLLGLRRPHHWAALRPRAVEATFESLLQGWRAVVIDTDGEAEPAALAESDDVVRRTILTRTAFAVASRILVVGEATTKGLYSLAQLMHELVECGISADRLVPLINRAPKSPHHRSLLGRTLSDLTGEKDMLSLAAPLFVPEHRRIEAAVRDADRLPRSITDAARAAMMVETNGRPSQEPELVEPGSLGAWGETA